MGEFDPTPDELKNKNFLEKIMDFFEKAEEKIGIPADYLVLGVVILVIVFFMLMLLGGGGDLE